MQIKQMVEEGPGKKHMIVGFASIGMITFVGVCYYFTKKNLRFGLQFSNLQSFFTIIISMELSPVGSETPKMYYMLVFISLITTLSFVSYCKIQLLACYLVSLIYVGVRSYSWFAVQSHIEYLKFYSFMILTYVFVYLFSRENINRDRLLFKKKHSQR
jgi:hypothetical protein